MNIIFWIIFGTLAGWTESIIVNTTQKKNIVISISLGILGALMGGMITLFFVKNGLWDLTLYSILASIIGALVFIQAGKFLRKD